MSLVSSAEAPKSARPTSSLYEPSRSGAASTRKHSGTMEERQSPPPYLESQRRASWAASRSLVTSLWPTRSSGPSAAVSGPGCTGTPPCAPGALSVPRIVAWAAVGSRATDGSAGVMSQRDAGVA